MNEKAPPHPYIPNSVPEVKAEMLAAVGVADVMDLYSEVPEHLRFHGTLNLPPPIADERTLRRHLEGLLARNKNCTEHLNFLGAGCAQHFVPAVCDEIAGRGEFLTAYAGTSYADHGKWQAFFEFASMLAELVEMDVVGTGLYDGTQATSTALRMASRINGRKEVLVPRSMNPDTLMVVRHYLMGVSEPFAAVNTVDFDPRTGQMDIADLKSKVSSATAAVLVEMPGYLGVIDAQVEDIGNIARESGAEFIIHADPISLGVIASPAALGATMACGDYHPLGIHMNCGGGQAGFIATPEDRQYLAQFKDRLAAITETVLEGEYAFEHVLYDQTHFSAREKGNEYTGTWMGLWAITGAVYLSLMGPKGMAEVGRTIMQQAQYAARLITRIEGVEMALDAPFFKEFAVNFDGTGKSVREINKALLDHRIFGGRDLSGTFPDLGQAALFCVTENMTKDDIDTMAEALAEVVR